MCTEDVAARPMQTGRRSVYAVIDLFFFFSSRRRHTRLQGDWSSDVCSSDLLHRPGPCFAAPVGGEVVVRARKLVGSAQVRRGGAFLQHGSILLDGSQEIIAEIGRASCRERV